VSAVPSPAAAVSPGPSPVAAVSPVASPSAAAGPGAQAALPAPSSPQVSGGKKIALLLPQSRTTRHESQDRPDFQAELQKICSDCQPIYSNANRIQFPAPTGPRHRSEGCAPLGLPAEQSAA